MIARAAALFAVGVLGLLGLAALSEWAAQTVWPSYLAAWLAVSALPLGALAIVMGHDALGVADGPITLRLRAFLPAMPLAAVMAIPMLIWRDRFYGLPDLRANPFAATWMTPDAAFARGAVMLVVWVILAALFRLPPAPDRGRTGLAVLGLALHVVMSTLAAVDWVASADRNLVSSSLGLILLAGQAGAALSIASLLVPKVLSDRHMLAGSVSLMVLFGAWLFMQFAQYLVVWSANLPAEAVWYLRRGGALGGGAEIGAFVVLAIGIVGFVPGIGDRFVRLFEALVPLTIIASMYWLVVPSSRGEVSFHLADAAAFIGLAGFVGGLDLVLWRGGDRRRQVTHGPA